MEKLKKFIKKRKESNPFDNLDHFLGDDLSDRDSSPYRPRTALSTTSPSNLSKKLIKRTENSKDDLSATSDVSSSSSDVFSPRRSSLNSPLSILSNSSLSPSSSFEINAENPLSPSRSSFLLLFLSILLLLLITIIY